MIKLTNGETLLASMINKDETHLYVNNPILIEFNTTSVYSACWIPLPEMSNIIPLKSDHVITYSRSGDETTAFYNRTVEKLMMVMQPEPELEFDKQEKMEEYRNKIRLIREPAANTVH
jgi:hypothetical protein